MQKMLAVVTRLKIMSNSTSKSLGAQPCGQPDLAHEAAQSRLP
jgi:hypothetical protein